MLTTPSERCSRCQQHFPSTGNDSFSSEPPASPSDSGSNVSAGPRIPKRRVQFRDPLFSIRNISLRPSHPLMLSAATELNEQRLNGGPEESANARVGHATSQTRSSAWSSTFKRTNGRLRRQHEQRSGHRCSEDEGCSGNEAEENAAKPSEVWHRITKLFSAFNRPTTSRPESLEQEKRSASFMDEKLEIQVIPPPPPPPPQEAPSTPLRTSPPPSALKARSSFDKPTTETRPSSDEPSAPLLCAQCQLIETNPTRPEFKDPPSPTTSNDKPRSDPEFLKVYEHVYDRRPPSPPESPSLDPNRPSISLTIRSSAPSPPASPNVKFYASIEKRSLPASPRRRGRLDDLFGISIPHVAPGQE
ncbi:hypothetical protein HDU96_008561 [Phlyctochytrium bullatum]|nr:hypothetical protein HDU96_008561 [Phlyctochytrium bullatum]